MSIFRKGNNTYKDCDSTEMPACVTQHEIFPQANVKIVGADAQSCNQIEANTRQALNQIGMKFSIQRFDTFGPEDCCQAPTPALIYNNAVLFSGEVPSTDAIEQKIRSC